MSANSHSRLTGAGDAPILASGLEVASVVDLASLFRLSENHGFRVKSKNK